MAADAITIHVPNGWPCGYDTVQVTPEQIRALEAKPDWTATERRTVAAYLRAGGE